MAHSSAMPPIRFFFDFISPYSYLAWTQVHALGDRVGRGVEPVPFFLAGVLKALKTPAPVYNPPRARYMLKDCARKARVLGVPFAPPTSFPFNSLLALRLTALDLAPETRRALVDRLFALSWAEGSGVGERAVVATVAGNVGLPAALLDQAEGDTGKARVLANTDEALAAGAFGSPTLLVDGELFFGLDSFPTIEQFASGNDVPGEVFARWGVA
jgi:2-hydroxychromene-2-carboxylate isomerase